MTELAQQADVPAAGRDRWRADENIGQPHIFASTGEVRETPNGHDKDSAVCDVIAVFDVIDGQLKDCYTGALVGQSWLRARLDKSKVNPEGGALLCGVLRTQKTQAGNEMYVLEDVSPRMFDELKEWVGKHLEGDTSEGFKLVGITPTNESEPPAIDDDDDDDDDVDDDPY